MHKTETKQAALIKKKKIYPTNEEISHFPINTSIKSSQKLPDVQDWELCPVLYVLKQLKLWKSSMTETNVKH